jgi:lactate dehydrogenase-like 2-hydroxyacid dehydrogenase
MSTPALLILTPLPEVLMSELQAHYRCMDGGDPAQLSEVRAAVGHGGAVVKAELLDTLPNLEIVAINGVGYDGVDVEACRSRRVKVTHTPDVLTDDVADLAVALVLMTSRGLVQANRDLHAGQWAAGASRLTQKASGKRAGIVGLGRIGKAIAHRLAAFSMELAYHSRRAQPVEMRYFPDLTEMAAWCDFLVVITPGGAGTRHLVNASVMKALGRKGILINVARGSVVDEAALIAALEAGELGGAGLDVFEHEPEVPVALLNRPELVLLPHVGSATQQTRGAMAQLVVDNLRAHFAEEPLKTLIPELQ